MAKIADILPGFMRETITMPNDYDGVCVTTLVSKKCATASKKAVLYVHGYSDYFFQNELADFYISKGFNFYAVDLRKYGRSLLTNQHYNFCKDMKEYYADLDAVMKIIRTTDGNTKVLLNGHSTGGLLAANYANDRKSAGTINALFLNSPFFDFNDKWWTEAFIAFIKTLVTGAGLLTPFLVTPGGGLPLYGESVHKNYNRGGTYVFKEAWKPVRDWAPPVCAGWIRAIRLAQEKVHAGLSITVPTLLMRSDKTGGGTTWNDSYNNSDCVLDVAEIHNYGINLNKGAAVGTFSEVIIPNGLHDLACSRSVPRAAFFSALGTWLAKI